MSTPPATLLELSGIVAPNSPWPGHTALVFIDVQADYGPAGALPLPHIAPALAQLSRLRQAAKAAGAPVVHIAHKAPENSPVFAQGSAGADFLPGFQPADGELCLNKSLPSSFTLTGLHERLQQGEIHRLILGGFMSHMCVQSTAREACERGYQVFVPHDGCASRDLPNVVSGSVLDARSVHETAMSFLADRFAFIQDADWIIKHLF